MSGAGAIAATPTQRDDMLRVLENEHIRVEIAPSHGGKIVSLLSKRTATEWLLPPLRPHAEAKTTAGFEQWDGGGFDECLPTVAATDIAPDHGELWRQSWVQEPVPTAVTLSAVVCQGMIRVRRHAWLEGVTLVLDYTVQNIGRASRSLLYSAHPLLRVEAGDRILLPEEVRSVLVEGSREHRLGKRGDHLPWPLSHRGDANAGAEDMSIVAPPDGLRADKLFAGPLQSGWCALFRPSLGEGLEIAFSADVLPYVGLWICRAAWPETGAAKQYTVALEPASAPCDSLADAEREGTAWRMEPGQRREWTLRLRLIEEYPTHGSKAAGERGL